MTDPTPEELRELAKGWRLCRDIFGGESQAGELTARALERWAEELERKRHDQKTYSCLICGRPVPEYVPVLCCDGRDCGCQGQPTEPCVCSNECSAALMNGIGKPYEQRRIDAGVPKYQP